MVKLQFTISCTFVLVGTEHNPFITVYLTKDIAPGNSPYVLVNSDHTGKITNAVVSFDVERRALVGMERDAALCVQGFCHLENKNGESCIHRVGYHDVFISALRRFSQTHTADKPGHIKLQLINRTSDAVPRGRLNVVVLDQATRTTLVESVVIPPRTSLTIDTQNLDNYETAFIGYRNRTDAILGVLPPIRKDIPLSRLPFYAFNNFAAPPIAFIMFEVPRNPEHYYLNALHIILRRRNENSDGVSDEDLLKLFLENSVTPWAERGAILCGVVSLLATACPYITDLGLWTNEKTKRMELRSVEEFARTVRLTLSGDCEDFSIEILMELADILTNTWTSLAMRMLQHARQQYVAQVPLKMVTRPAAYSPDQRKIGDGKEKPEKPQKLFSAHNNVDLIPVEKFVEMQELLETSDTPELRPSPATRATNQKLLAERRGQLVTGNRDLGILIIEGTGMYKPDGGVYTSRLQRKHLYRAGPEAFEGAKHTIREKARRESKFYRATVSAIVWDTFRLYTPEVPTTAQIFYTQKTPDGTMHYAAHHPDYVRAESSVAIYAAPPATPEEMAMMRHVERYDHPIPVIVPQDEQETARMTKVLIGEGLDEFVQSVANLRRPQNVTDVYVDVHFPALTMSRARIRALWNAAKYSGIVNHLSYYIEPVAKGLSLVLLRFRCNKNLTSGSGQFVGRW